MYSNVTIAVSLVAIAVAIFIAFIFVPGVIFPELSASPHSGTVATSIPYQSSYLNLNGSSDSLRSYNLTIIYHSGSLQTTVDCADFPVGSHFPVLAWKYFFIFGENLEVGKLPSGCQTPEGY